MGCLIVKKWKCSSILFTYIFTFAVSFFSSFMKACILLY